MRTVIYLFIISILLTAVFSYSLAAFLRIGFISLTLKGMLIPCFTWSVLIIAAYQKMNRERFIDYLIIAATVCAIGSAVLVPGGVYNFISLQPVVKWSVVNVLVSVFVMSLLFYFLLRRKNFSLKWWWAFNILICINMTIFYFAATH